MEEPLQDRTKVVWQMGKFFRYLSKTGTVYSNIIGTCYLHVYKQSAIENGDDDNIHKGEQFTLDSMVRSLLSRGTLSDSSSVSGIINKQNGPSSSKREIKTPKWKETFQGEAVFKFSRVPHWGPFWERRVYKVLKEYCPCLTNFVGAKMMSCAKLFCDPKGFALPQTRPTLLSKKSRLVDLTIYDKVEGTTFANNIASKLSRTEISYILQQILAVQYMSQLYCQYTHYDSHCSNVMLEPNNDFSWIYYKFNQNISVLLPSSGFKIKIIDFEFSHVGGLHGKNFDAKPDLFEAGYSSQRFDPEADPVYLLMNAFYIFKEHRKNDVPLKMIRSFLNSIKTRPFEDKGFFCRTRDPLRDLVLQKLKGKDPGLYNFVFRWYERLVAFLLHFVIIDEKKTVKNKFEDHFQRFVWADKKDGDQFSIKIVGDLDGWSSDAIQYFAFMYSLRSLVGIHRIEIDCFNKIYDWIQHKGSDGLFSNPLQRETFAGHVKKLSKKTFEIYGGFVNVAFPLKQYNSQENWDQWNAMKKTKKYDQSLVFDPIVALDFLSTHIPTNIPFNKNNQVCIVSFDQNDESIVELSEEFSKSLSSVSDPFKRAKDFEKFFIE